MTYCDTQWWPATVLSGESGRVSKRNEPCPILTFEWPDFMHTHYTVISYQCLPVMKACDVEVLCCYCPKLCERSCWHWSNDNNKKKLNEVDKRMLYGNKTTCSRHRAVLLRLQRWPLPSALYWAPVSLLCVLSIPTPLRGRCGTQDVGHTAFRPIFCLIYKVFSLVAFRRADAPAPL